MPKFIVLRGPSGSGKSTVAKKLHTAYPNPTLLVQEDQIRFMFNNWKEASHTASKELATESILCGLRNGFDVIFEGISNVKTYGKYFQQIFDEHPDENYFFYLEVDFEETVRRHETRPQSTEFGPDEMKRWLEYATPTGYEFETIISQGLSVEETIQKITDVISN